MREENRQLRIIEENEKKINKQMEIPKTEKIHALRRKRKKNRSAQASREERMKFLQIREQRKKERKKIKNKNNRNIYVKLQTANKFIRTIKNN